MNTQQVIKEINRILGQHKGSEYELMEALVDLASGWEMRFEELQDESQEEENDD